MKRIITSALLLLSLSLTAQQVPCSIQIEKITLFASNTVKMKQFYSEVFGATFTKTNDYGVPSYFGEICGIGLLITTVQGSSSSIKQNSHQFNFIISDIAATLRNVHANGGKSKGEICETKTQKSITVIDPDGNSIVFIQKLKLIN